ncbi:MAG: hypoxanthine phosphoribosyltransferase, partial [Clostridia bacterium]|nr:hypoxanthine phosphoribosyltransferase [Clostridia bacterium]
SLKKMRELLGGRGAKSFTVVTLLDKPARRQVDIKADYSCFEIENEFIVGYGLDYAQRYRNLPYIGVLKHSVYEK